MVISRVRPRALASPHLFMVVLATMLAPMSLFMAHPLVRATMSAATSSAPRSPNFAQLPLSFIPNVGQYDSHIRFQTNGMGGTVAFTPQELVLTLPVDAPATVTSQSRNASAAQVPLSTAIHMHFLGANQTPAITSGAQLPGVVNFMSGTDQTRWRSGVPTYDSLGYQHIYPGIDLRYEGTQGQLKSTYTVAPGVDPSVIRWRYAEATSVRLNQQTGAVQVGVPGTTTPIVEHAPVVWQDIGGERVQVESRYVLGADNSIGFAFGSYNVAYPLTIDPVTAYRTFLGGANTDEGYDIAVDGTSVYIVGYTFSSGLTGFTGSQAGSADVFVAKFDATLSTLNYGTYLGGSGTDRGYAIAIDGSGNAYVTGQTVAAAPTAFPTTAGVAQTANAGGSDAFVAKLNATGALAYSTLYGGNLDDRGNDIAVDAASNAYIVGTTLSNVAPFAGNAGGADAFMVGFNTGATATLFAPQLRGGTSIDEGNGIAVNTTGIYIVGTTSSAAGVSTVGVVQATLSAGGSDAFVAKYPVAGGAPTYATYLGGNNNDIGESVAVDAAGSVYVAGQTTSLDFTAAPRVPAVAPYQGALNGPADGFVTQLNAAGTAVQYNTYLGGGSTDSANAILVDGSNNVYVTGDTFSTNFPLPGGVALQTANAGGQDSFVTQFNTGSGNSLVYSTYLGGNTTDSGRGIALRTTGSTKEVYVVGGTSSTAFPTTVTNTPYQTANAGGGDDAFVVRIGIQQPTLTNDTATTLEDTPVTVNVLANDSAAPATFVPSTVQLIASSLTPSTAGVLAVNPDGTITFTPAANQNSTTFGGNVTFRYTACDSDGVCGDPATVTITVTPVNDAPTFNLSLGSVTVAEDSGAQLIPGFATGITRGPATATDEAGQILTFQVAAERTNLFSVQPAIDPATGNLTFTPAPNANGTTTVSVLLRDDGGTANGGVDTAGPLSFTLTITAVNDPPVAGAPPTFAAVEGRPSDIPVAGLNVNDNADISAPADTATAAPFPPASSVTVVTPPTQGTVSPFDSTNQKLVYTPNANTGATTDSFQVSVCDNGTPAPPACVTQTVNIAITLVNDPPTANPDGYTVSEDNTLIVGAPGVLLNDTDPNVPSALPLSVVSVSVPSNGIVAIGADGSFIYKPNPNFYGTDTFTYSAKNSGPTNGSPFDNPTSAPTTVTITVTPVPDAPVAGNDTYSTNEDTALTVVAPGVLVNDSDVDCPGSALAGCGTLVPSVQTPPANGSVTVNADGSFVYTPALNFNGTDSFTYLVTSSADGATSNTATVTITVNAVNDAPVVSFPSAPNTFDEETSYKLPPLTITDVDYPGPPAVERVTLASEKNIGTLTLNATAGLTIVAGANGSASVTFQGTLPDLNAALTNVTYTPLPNANGPERVVITVDDQSNTPAPPQIGTFRIDLTINPINDAPVAANDTFTVLEDVLTRTLVLANDNDNNDTQLPAQVVGGGLDPKTVQIVTPPANGTATPNADGTISYQSNPNYNGPDSFTYKVCDTGVPLPSLCTNTATVNLTVVAVNDAPTATAGPDTVSVAEDSGAYSQPWGTNIVAGPANESTQTLTVAITNTNSALFAVQPQLALNGGAGTLTFTPALNANGSASVTVTIKDNGGTANGGQDTLVLKFTIVVTPVNDPPTAVNDRLGVGFNSVTPLPVLQNDSIAPDANETLRVAAIPTLPQHGTVVIASDGLSVIFTPTNGYKGPDSFVYQVCDNGQTNGVADPKCATATVTLTIGIFNVYLPITLRYPQPDLVGSFKLSPVPTRPGEDTRITVTVTNTGSLPASNFWVDFYIEPKNAPTGANTPWDENCKLNPCYGIAWFVSETIEPGQSITLTSTSGSYARDNTIWRGFFIRGTKNLYLVVDSWNRSPGGSTGDPNGAVQEFDETNNVSYQKIDLSTSSTDAADAPTPANEPQPETLAPRSLKPQ